MDNPAAFVISIIASAVILSIIPLLIAVCIKSYITETKYWLYCLLGNFVLEIAVTLILQADLSSFRPFALVLWTSVGSLIGSKILKKKGLYLKKGEVPPDGSANISGSVTSSATPQDKVASLMKIYSTKTDADLQNILTGGYTQEAKFAAQELLNQRRGLHQSQPYRPAQQPQYDNHSSQLYTNYGQQYSAPQPQQQYNGGYAQQQYSARPQPAAPKFCTRCGSQLTAGSRFCSNCGADTTK